jgi:O-methyltransferase domain/Dimerisation domain
MTRTLPTSNDHDLWQFPFSAFQLPTLQAALDLDIFESLAVAPSSPEDLARRLKLNHRGIRAIVPALAAFGLLSQRAGRYHLTDLSRDFLLRSSPFYLGVAMQVLVPFSREHLVQLARSPDTQSRWDVTSGDTPADNWSDGQIDLATGRMIAEYMHVLAWPGAMVAARSFEMGASRRLLDVGAGSGAFSIAFAEANPHLHCTLMDLKTMCEVAMTQYVSHSHASARIDTASVDMFRQPWPGGYDTIFFSNVFHDWDFETCRMLSAKAFEVLPKGGRIVLHEMLLADTRDGPPLAALFSVYMLAGTKGQQFTAPDLSAILGAAGFIEFQVTPAHGAYALVSARKP